MFRNVFWCFKNEQPYPPFFNLQNVLSPNGKYENNFPVGPNDFSFRLLGNPWTKLKNTSEIRFLSKKNYIPRKGKSESTFPRGPIDFSYKLLVHRWTKIDRSKTQVEFDYFLLKHSFIPQREVRNYFPSGPIDFSFTLWFHP